MSNSNGHIFNRRDRGIEQSANDIYLMQDGVTTAMTDMDKADKRMVPYLDKMPKNHGMQTFSDLKTKLGGALTPEQKKAYDILVDRFNDVGHWSHDDAVTAISGISFFFGILGKGIDLANFLFCGHVMNTFNGEAFYILTTDGYEPPVAW